MVKCENFCLGLTVDSDGDLRSNVQASAVIELGLKMWIGRSNTNKHLDALSSANNYAVENVLRHAFYLICNDWSIMMYIHALHVEL